MEPERTTDTHSAREPEDPLAETDADWLGTPLRSGALAVWAVNSGRAVVGEVVSWDRHFVTVKPLRQAYRLQGGVAKAEGRDPRPYTVDRMKLTILRPLGPGQVAGG